MKVSLSWLGVILIVSVILYFSWYGITIYETFKNDDEKEEEIEPFVTKDPISGIEISTCPADTKSFIDKKGFTLCCEGRATSDTCHGNILCSLSESVRNIPTCSTWVEAYMKERANGRCPASMPNYFENGKIMGCTSGPLKRDATGPADITTSKTCHIYPEQVDDEGKLDSCTNIKLLDSTLCFQTSKINSEKQLVSVSNETLPALVSCKYGDITDGTAGICQDDASVVRNMLAQLKDSAKLSGWKASSGSWDPIQKLNFCSVIEKFKILKTHPFTDLPVYNIFPSA
jgi:hypothetical protein